MCDLYAHICHTQRHATTLHGGEAQTQGHTGTHTQKPASGDNGGWKDTTGGDADERRRRRRDDQVLEQLSATDTLKDNPRFLSPHVRVESIPKGFPRAKAEVFSAWHIGRPLFRGIHSGDHNRWRVQPRQVKRRLSPMPRGLGRFELNRFNGRSCCRLERYYSPSYQLASL